MTSPKYDGATDSTVLDFDYDDAVRQDAPLERISGTSTRTVGNDGWYRDHYKEWTLDDLATDLVYDQPSLGVPTEFTQAEDSFLETTRRHSGLSVSRGLGPSNYTPQFSFNDQVSNQDEGNIYTYMSEPWSAWPADFPALHGIASQATSVSSSSDFWGLRAESSLMHLSFPSPILDVTSTAGAYGTANLRQERATLPKLEESSHSRDASPIGNLRLERFARLDSSSSQQGIASLPSSFKQHYVVPGPLARDAFSSVGQSPTSSGGHNVPEGTLTCPRCPVSQRRTYRRAGDYRRHMKMHEVPQHHKCSFPNCERTFYRHDKMKAHLRKVHNVEEGGIGYAELSSSRSGTPTAEDLGNHESLHTCSECSSEFRRLPDLNRHFERKHARRHECDQCQATFTLKADLERHRNTVHQMGQTTRYRCTKGNCSQEFPRKDNLLRHIKRTHPEDNAESEPSNVVLSSSLPIAPKPS